jgi:hypothetical protein
MKAFLCLIAITALVGLLYVYMRQQLQSVNAQIEQLRELTKSMALELRDDRDREPVAAPSSPTVSTPIAPRLYVVSDDSESEDDTDEESDDDSVDDIQIQEMVKVAKIEAPVEAKVEPKVEVKSVVVENLDFQVEELETKVEKVNSEVELDLILDITEDAKVINVDMSAKLESYSVKELKDMVAAKGGPASLKTKKAMIDFLEKLK